MITRSVSTIVILLAAAFILFGSPVGVQAENQVVIKRDSYGMPHIYADNIHSLFFGYGYAIAQDRLYQTEISKRSTQGRMAEIFGEKYLEFDKRIRQHYSPDSIHRQIEALSADDQAIFQGYAEGINAWIKEIEKNPNELMPKQFMDNGFKPEPWTAFDVVMIFVGSMVNRFGDFNTEIQNQQLLDALVEAHGRKKGRQIFNQLLAVEDRNAPTTIPPGEWDPTRRSSVLSQPDISTATAWPRPAISDKTAQDITRIPIGIDGALHPMPAAKVREYLDFHLAEFGLSGVAGYPQTSNIVVLGKKKTKDATAILLNGPQFGWYNPAYTYSVGLHGAGFNAVGNSPFGYPGVQFGFNEHISWGSTWGAGDLVDIYREILNPNNPEEYLFKAAYRAMEKRTETIRLKGADPVSYVVYRTIHGPVISMDVKNGIAYAKKRGWDGYELDMLMGWINATKATNHQEWLEQVARSSINVNWYYADRAGNIAYAFTGRYPKRSVGHDGRLPASGAGYMEWEGIMPFTTNPQILNPSTGYIANWNNKPAEGFPNPDEWWYSWAEADRVAFLMESLASKDTFTADEVWKFMMEASFIDLNARYFIPYIGAAVAVAETPAKLKQAYQILQEWDYFSKDRDQNGHYDEAATAIFRTWLPIMVEQTLRDDLPGNFFKWFASAGYPTPQSPPRASLNVQPGAKVVHQALRGRKSGLFQAYDFFNGQDPKALIRASLEAALARLEKEQGPDMMQWRLPVAHHQFFTSNFLGIPQAGQDEGLRLPVAMNRGTENNMTVFSPDGVLGYEVAPPGQNGFIAPDGTPSSHYADQLNMYGELGRKPVWIYDQDIDRNAESGLMLTY